MLRPVEGEKKDDEQATPEEALGAVGWAFIAFTKVFFGLAALLLFAFSFSLIGLAAWGLGLALLHDRPLMLETLESIGLIIIAIAVFDVAKFLIEEEVINERQLRSIRQARASLTKFFTIIIIAISLEAIVVVIETKLESIEKLIYPVSLMAVGVFALIGLGLFQKLTSPAQGGRPRNGEEHA